MPHFKVSDDAHSHPKVVMAGDAAWGMWNRAGCFAMAYGTDGWVPEWWVKQQPQGTAKAKKLMAAQLWYPGEYAGDRPEYQGQKGYNFHQWRQDSYEKVEADREKWRVKKEAQRAAQEAKSPKMSPGDKRGDTTGDKPGDSPGESRESPGYIPTTHYPSDSSNHLESASHDSTAHEPRSAPVRPDAWKLVREIIPAEHPNATKTELALQASAQLNQGQPTDLIAETLAYWLTKSVHPKTFPSLVSELINNRNRASGHTQTTPGRGRPIARSQGILDATARLINQPNQPEIGA